MTPESPPSERLVWMFLPPVVWALHFLACYITAAVWCAKAVALHGPLGDARIAILVYTVGALVLLGLLAARAWRRYHDTTALDELHTTARDRRRFLGFMGLLLSALSAAAVVLVAQPTLHFTTCR